MNHKSFTFSFLVVTLLVGSHTTLAFTQAEITIATGSTTCPSPKRIITTSEGNSQNDELCALLPSVTGSYEYASENAQYGLRNLIEKTAGSNTCNLNIGSPRSGFPFKGAICYQECGGACTAGETCTNSVCKSKCTIVGQGWDTATSTCVCNVYNGFKKKSVSGKTCYQYCYGTAMVTDSDRTTIASCKCIPGATISGENCVCEQAGKYISDTACTTCLANSYCTGDGNSLSCPTDSRSPAGSSSLTDCICKAGTYAETAGGACRTCPADSYCPGNGNLFASDCPKNSKSPSGSSSATDCLCKPGSYSVMSGGTCNTCPAGTYCSGGTSITQCSSGFSSAAGSSSAADCVCSAGTFSYPGGGSCHVCPSGSYCSGGAAISPCPAGRDSAQGSKSDIDCNKSSSASGLIDNLVISTLLCLILAVL